MLLVIGGGQCTALHEQRAMLTYSGCGGAAHTPLPVPTHTVAPTKMVACLQLVGGARSPECLVEVLTCFWVSGESAAALWVCVGQHTVLHELRYCRVFASVGDSLDRQPQTLSSEP